MSRLKIATTLKPVNWNCFWLGSLNVDLLKRLSTKLWKWMQPQPVAICKYQVLICCLAWDNFTAVWRFVVWIGYLNIYWAFNGAHLLISSHSLLFHPIHAAIVHSSYNDNIFFWICEKFFHYFTSKSRSLILWYVHEILGLWCNLDQTSFIRGRLSIFKSNENNILSIISFLANAFSFKTKTQISAKVILAHFSLSYRSDLLNSLKFWILVVFCI